jgi:hypothetical protein
MSGRAFAASYYRVRTQFYLPRRLHFSTRIAQSVSLRVGRSVDRIQVRTGFPQTSRRILRPNQLPLQWLWGLSWSVKRPGRGVEHRFSFSAEVKNKVEPKLYFFSGSSWPVKGWNLPVPFFMQRRLVVADVSAQPIGSFFKCQAVFL